MLTSSPFKKQLEQKENEKMVSAKQKSSNLTPSHLAERSKKTDRLDTEAKTIIQSAKSSSKPSATNGKKSSTHAGGRSRAKNLCIKSSRSEKKDQCKCICGVVEGSKEDNDGWIKCNTCGKWQHEHCAEISGVFDDDYFFCSVACMQ